MGAGTDAVNELKPELSAIAGTKDPQAAKPHVSRAVSLLQGAQSGISIGLAGIITLGISNNYNDLLDVFKKGLTALDGPNANKAMSDLQALSKQALGQLAKVS